jgi:hypothetical protein
MTKPGRRNLPPPMSEEADEGEGARAPVTLPTIEPRKHAAAFRAALDRHEARINSAPLRAKPSRRS